MSLVVSGEIMPVKQMAIMPKEGLLPPPVYNSVSELGHHVSNVDSSAGAAAQHVRAFIITRTSISHWFLAVTQAVIWIYVWFEFMSVIKCGSVSVWMHYLASMSSLRQCSILNISNSFSVPWKLCLRWTSWFSFAYFEGDIQPAWKLHQIFINT